MLKKFKNEDIVFTGGLLLFGFLSIILKKLYMIKGFISYINGLFIITYIVKLCKVLTNEEELNQMAIIVFGNNDNYKNKKTTKEDEHIFGFDMRAQD